MIPHRSSCHLHRRGRCFSSAFTLIELLAVVLIILVLAGLLIQLTGYVKRTMAVNQAKAELAAMVLALDRYKADYGRYPTTTVVRCSYIGGAEATNSAILYAALQGRYLRFCSSQIRPPSGGNQYVVDPWGRPYNYYCVGPASGVSTTYVDNVSRCAIGGQVNTTTFDLFSYGPDSVTWVPGADLPGFPVAMKGPLSWVGWSNSVNSIDDIIYNKY